MLQVYGLIKTLSFARNPKKSLTANLIKETPFCEFVEIVTVQEVFS